MSAGTLYLIPWHIGEMMDTTFNAALLAQRLDVLFVEDIEDARRQLRIVLKVDASGKTLTRIPEAADADFLKTALAALERGDAGMLSSGGVPGFIDPGAWLVAELRRRGIAVKALAGASCLSTMLALSGVEWRQGADNVFTFAFFADCDLDAFETRAFQSAVSRPESVFVFLRPPSLARCLALLEPVIGARPVTLFFDLTKPRKYFPLADVVETKSCKQWRRDAPALPWDRIGDVALMVGR